MAEQDADLSKIAIFLGQEFAKMSLVFVPRCAKGLLETNKKISFGATVTMEFNEFGVVEAFLVPKAPKIPTEDLDPVPCILTHGAEQQLMLEFKGPYVELAAALDARSVDATDITPEDDYQPTGESAPSDKARLAALMSSDPSVTAP